MGNLEIKFQSNFRKIRVQNGLTIQELSDMTRLSRTILYEYQRGKHFPTSKNIKVLAKALNCKVKDFFN